MPSEYQKNIEFLKNHIPKITELSYQGVAVQDIHTSHFKEINFDHFKLFCSKFVKVNKIKEEKRQQENLYLESLVPQIISLFEERKTLKEIYKRIGIEHPSPYRFELFCRYNPSIAAAKKAIKDAEQERMAGFIAEMQMPNANREILCKKYGLKVENSYSIMQRRKPKTANTSINVRYDKKKPVDKFPQTDTPIPERAEEHFTDYLINPKTGAYQFSAKGQCKYIHPGINRYGDYWCGQKAQAYRCKSNYCPDCYHKVHYLGRKLLGLEAA